MIMRFFGPYRVCPGLPKLGPHTPTSEELKDYTTLNYDGLLFAHITLRVSSFFHRNFSVSCGLQHKRREAVIKHMLLCLRDLYVICHPVTHLRLAGRTTTRMTTAATVIPQRCLAAALCSRTSLNPAPQPLDTSVP